MPALRVAIFSQVPLTFKLMYDAATRRGYKVLVVVTCFGPRSRMSTECLKVVQMVPRGVDVLLSDKPKLYAQRLRDYALDLILCCAYSWKFRPDLLSLPQLGCVNLHNSLLPKYRGPDAFAHSILQNDTIGFTVHYMDAEYDTGNVLVQEEMPLGVNEYICDKFPMFLELLPSLWDRALKMVEEGYKGVPQSSEGVSQAPVLEPHFQTIDFTTSTALQVHNQIRRGRS